MKKVVFVMMVLTTMIACNNQDETENIEIEEEVKIVSLTGKILEYNYGDDIYEIKFKSDDNLHWKCVKGDEKGKEANETYAMQRLNESTLFVSWVEEDGLGVSQVVNLKEHTINCFLKIEKDIIPLSGTVREL